MFERIRLKIPTDRYTNEDPSRLTKLDLLVLTEEYIKRLEVTRLAFLVDLSIYQSPLCPVCAACNADPISFTACCISIAPREPRHEGDVFRSPCKQRAALVAGE